MKRMRSEFEHRYTTTAYGTIAADADDLTQVLGKPESCVSDDHSGYILKWVYTSEDLTVFTISGWNDTRTIGDRKTRFVNWINWEIRGNNGEPTSAAAYEVQKLLQKYEDDFF